MNSREDEDLLDLMVRIAESPAEWERIHRVLNQLGADEERNTDENQNIMLTRNQSRRNQDNNKNVTKYNLTTEKFTTISSLGSINKNEETVTPLAETQTAPEYGNVKEIMRDNYETVETDTGWPDFREAILKKINKHIIENEEEHEMETNLFQNNMYDTPLRKYYEVNKQDNEQAFTTFPESNLIAPVVNFIPTKNRKESGSSKDPHVVRSRLYKDPKILEFPIKEHNIAKNTTSHQNSSGDANDILNKTLRPVFQYHRVTTSPQERKNSAFIAVSVVKQSSMMAPATDSAPVVQLEKTDNHWNGHYPHWAKGRSKSLTDYSQRKRLHSSRKIKHHTRDHRHHHTELYSYL